VHKARVSTDHHHVRQRDLAHRAVFTEAETIEKTLVQSSRGGAEKRSAETVLEGDLRRAALSTWQARSSATPVQDEIQTLRRKRISN